MSLSVNEIVNNALNLSERERAKIAHDLILSLDNSTDNYENAWDMEIKRRVEEIKSGKATGKPAADILAEIQAKYS